MVNQHLRLVDIVLHPLRHQHTDHSILAQGFHTQSRSYGTVLTAGNTHHRIAAGAVLFKKLPNPLHAAVFCFFCIKHKRNLHRTPKFHL